MNCRMCGKTFVNQELYNIHINFLCPCFPTALKLIDPNKYKNLYSLSNVVNKTKATYKHEDKQTVRKHGSY